MCSGLTIAMLLILLIPCSSNFKLLLREFKTRILFFLPLGGFTGARWESLKSVVGLTIMLELFAKLYILLTFSLSIGTIDCTKLRFGVILSINRSPFRNVPLEVLVFEVRSPAKGEG